MSCGDDGSDEEAAGEPRGVRAFETEEMTMSRLTIYADGRPESPEAVHTEAEAIRGALASFGARFERVTALVDLSSGASADDVLRAYAPFIDGEKKAYGYLFMLADADRDGYISAAEVRPRPFETRESPRILLYP